MEAISQIPTGPETNSLASRLLRGEYVRAPRVLGRMARRGRWTPVRKRSPPCPGQGASHRPVRTRN